MNWIKLHRKLTEKAFYSKDSEKVHLWIHLLMKANYGRREELLGSKPIVCNAGQFTTGRKQLSLETGISESKIERILSNFEKIEQQIEQQKTSSNRLITIVSWNDYQQSEQQSEQQVNNDRTTSEQQVNTLKEDKEDKEIKEDSKKPIKIDLQTRKENFITEISSFKDKYSKDMLNAFYNYWSELNPSKTKMKFELQKTFEVSKRLAYWSNQEFINKPNGNKQQAGATLNEIAALADKHFGHLPD